MHAGVARVQFLVSNYAVNQCANPTNNDQGPEDLVSIVGSEDQYTGLGALLMIARGWVSGQAWLFNTDTTWGLSLSPTWTGLMPIVLVATVTATLVSSLHRRQEGVNNGNDDAAAQRECVRACVRVLAANG